MFVISHGLYIMVLVRNFLYLIFMIRFNIYARDMVLIHMIWFEHMFRVHHVICFKHMVWYYICFKHMCYMILIPILYYMVRFAMVLTFGFNIILWVFSYGFFYIHLNTKGVPRCWQGSP